MSGTLRDSPLRRKLAQLLEGLQNDGPRFSAASHEAWSRRGMHPERGEVSIDDLLEIYADHGAHHAGQITDLRARKGW